MMQALADLLGAVRLRADQVPDRGQARDGFAGVWGVCGFRAFRIYIGYFRRFRQ